LFLYLLHQGEHFLSKEGISCIDVAADAITYRRLKEIFLPLDLSFRDNVPFSNT